MKFTPATILLACLLLFTIGNACNKKKDPDPGNTTTTTTTTAKYDFTPTDDVIIDEIVTFKSNAPESSSLLWKIDKTESAERQPSHTFQNEGFYTVSLVVDNDVANKVSKRIRAKKPPVFFWGYGMYVVGDTVRYTTTPPAGTDLTWDFGDGTTSKDVNPLHIYWKAGAYTVKLLVNQKHITDIHTTTIVDDPQYTHKIAGNRNWHFEGKYNYYSLVPDLTWTKDESFSITPVNKIQINTSGSAEIGDFTLTYDPSLSKGDVLVFKDAYRKLFFDHVMDTLYYIHDAKGVGKYTEDGKGYYDLYITGSSK